MDDGSGNAGWLLSVIEHVVDEQASWRTDPTKCGAAGSIGEGMEVQLGVGKVTIVEIVLCHFRRLLPGLHHRYLLSIMMHVSLICAAALPVMELNIPEWLSARLAWMDANTMW